jgi:hypothetical protein
MARVTKTTAARAVARDFLPLSLAALASVILLTLLATQAWAQKSPGPASPGGPPPAGQPANLIEDSIDICSSLSGDLTDAQNQMVAQGWSIDYSDSSGPYVWEVDASKIYSDGSNASIFALIETYPTGQITYCSFTADSVPNPPALETVEQIYDVTGEVQHYEGGADGTWEQVGDGVTYYALANVDLNYFYLQVTTVASGGLAGAPGGAPPAGGK